MQHQPQHRQAHQLQARVQPASVVHQSAAAVDKRTVSPSAVPASPDHLQAFPALVVSPAAEERLDPVVAAVAAVEAPLVPVATLIEDSAGTLLVASPWTPAMEMGAPASTVNPFSAVINGVQQQVEFYFSPLNLARDEFLVSRMDGDGWIDLSLLATFNRMRSLTTDLEVIYHALSLSQHLELRVVSWTPPIAKVRSAHHSQQMKTAMAGGSGDPTANQEEGILG